MLSSNTRDGTSSERFVAWMGQCDTCPECVANVEAPRHVEPTRDGFEAFYRCTDCRHAWTAAWMDWSE